MINVLIVEDELAISHLIKLSLTKEGYVCTCANDGKEAVELLDHYHYDLILLDVMLPYIDGFELIEYIKPLEIPVIFITAKNSVNDKVKGLRLGAEDYIVKPFEIIELLARVDVVLRRYHKTQEEFHVNGLKVNTRSMQVWKDNQEISLTKLEYDLLLLFVRNPNRAIYRESIYEQVWGGEYPYGSKTVDIHVQRLRKKVGWEKELQAINKVGYRLEVKK